MNVALTIANTMYVEPYIIQHRVTISSVSYCVEDTGRYIEGSLNIDEHRFSSEI